MKIKKERLFVKSKRKQLEVITRVTKPVNMTKITSDKWQEINLVYDYRS